VELGFLLTLIGLLAGIWIYLYNAILDLTATSFDFTTQLLLGVMHYAVLWYLVLVLYVFFHRGVGELTTKGRLPRESHRRCELATALVLQTWPVTFLALTATFCITKLSDSESAYKISTFVIFGSGALYQIYRQEKLKKERHPQKLTSGHIVGFYVNFLTLGTVYIFVMSCLLSTVRITTDKEFCLPSDPVIVSVRTGGYLFQPQVVKITLGDFERSKWPSTNDITSLVTPELRKRDNLVVVEYKPQAPGSTRKAYHELKVVSAE